MQDYRDCVKTNNLEFKAHWDDICTKAEQGEAAWIAELRNKGFKAAHPNDGWVNRKDNEIVLCYPQFNDGLKIGDTMMLGWPGDTERQRPIKIIGERHTFTKLVYYKFEDINKVRGFFARLFR